MAARKKVEVGEVITIKSPNFRIVPVPIRGTSIFVSNNFAEEMKNQMADDMRKGSVDKKKKGTAKPPKDFEAGYRGSMHQSVEGLQGIPCIAFRSSMVRAAQLCGVEMTRAKMCVFVEADAFDSEGRGLVLFTKGEPEYFEAYVRNSNGGPDIRARARFARGWEATVRIRYDADFLSSTSVVNLLLRAGISVGVGAGRPFSQMSVGQNWGTFEVCEGEMQAAAE